jgi:hypothetical protein
MYNSLESESRNEGSTFEFNGVNTEYSELDILRKAYELILENSDLFFCELANAFTIERERRESNLLL